MAGFLVAQQIEKLINQGVVQSANIGKCLGPASYQVRVGSYRETQKSSPETLPPGEAVVIQPGGLLLIGGCETVQFPDNIIGVLHLRSSYARRGLLPWSQGIIEPGYTGGVTIVLHNHSNDYIPIVGDERICHLMFQMTDERTDKPYRESYQNLPGATPATEVPILRVAGDIVGKISEGLTTAVIKTLSGT